MSWSICISGPKEIVVRELADALLVFDKALTWAEGSDLQDVSVSLGGYVSWDENRKVTASGTSFSFGDSNPYPDSDPAPDEEIPPTEEDIPKEKSI